MNDQNDPKGNLADNQGGSSFGEGSSTFSAQQPTSSVQDDSYGQFPNKPRETYQSYPNVHDSPAGSQPTGSSFTPLSQENQTAPSTSQPSQISSFANVEATSSSQNAQDFGTQEPLPQVPPAQPPQTQTQPQQTPPAPQNSMVGSSKKQSKKIILIIALFILLVASAGAYFFMQSRQDQPVDEVTEEVTDDQINQDENVPREIDYSDTDLIRAVTAVSAAENYEIKVASIKNSSGCNWETNVLAKVSSADFYKNQESKEVDVQQNRCDPDSLPETYEAYRLDGVYYKKQIDDTTFQVVDEEIIISEILPPSEEIALIIPYPTLLKVSKAEIVERKTIVSASYQSEDLIGVYEIDLDSMGRIDTIRSETTVPADGSDYSEKAEFTFNYGPQVITSPVTSS